jgi:hypothetical protein
MTATTAYETAPAVPAAPLSKRAEQREDARLRMELELAREAARAEQRRKDDAAWAEERRTARAAKKASKDEAREDRALRNVARQWWLRDHAVDLLFVPVIGVPGALAWDAMAAYGAATWGPLGVALPLFSEGAMWAFDAAIAIRKRRDPDAPVWHLQIGLAIFACLGAALNFLHGVAPTTPHHSTVKAVSMALVSVAGVIAHQLVIAGPRKSRAAQEIDRFRRSAERRQAAARKAATQMALIDIDEEGHADLVYEPGTYRLSRGVFGTRLAAPKGRPAIAPRPANARPLGPRAAVPAWESEPGEHAGAAYRPVPQPVRNPAAPPAVPAGQPATAAEAPATADPDLRDAVEGTAGFPPPEFYGPDADRAGAGPAPEAPRDDSGPEDDGDDDAAVWASWPKEAVAAQLAPQIRAAAAAGTTWKPDYEQLIALTDRSKRTCESIVSIARRLAAAPEGDPGGVTEGDGGESSQSSQDGGGNVPGAARTAALQPAGAG